MGTGTKAAIFCLFMSMSLLNSYCQKTTIRIQLLDKSTSDASEFVFEIAIKNKGFEKYWVQDTTFLKEELLNPSEDLVYPFLWKKNNESIYKLYGNYKRRPGVGPPSKWMDSCKNCIFLKRGESLKVRLKMLECYLIDRGQYKLQVAIRPPLFSCNDCPQLAELSSNFIYFKVD
jgi:hypothetical protein